LTARNKDEEEAIASTWVRIDRNRENLNPNTYTRIDKRLIRKADRPG